MKELIRPIITLILTLLGGGSVLYFLNHNANLKTKKDKQENEIVQDFVNVKDIKDKFLYTRDNKTILYIKVSPIDINLLSKKEQKSLAKILTSQTSGIQKELKFLAVSRPVDISPLISEYQEILATTTNQKQKELLRKEILSVSDYSLNGEAVERQFYFILWEDYEEDSEKELLKRGNDLVSAFNTCEIAAEILREKGIYRLCNLVNNPAYINSEDETFNTTVPFLY
ncbi:hypothetical protein [Sporanaerobacter acetigenes]|uniref:Uncharacterized protein n=1 Tax=Sporanaerobacter acetigenes DSM 13106 TaxID=1123281 RepID=A0A1M5U782_9FIRM|nr:hypothetical protein [Sporanaerobacter acetigenes]SHH58751.1 hypothetical protein SAMN02745180_00545 [Sporanaerobacter acetigenes DSM 13106]